MRKKIKIYWLVLVVLLKQCHAPIVLDMVEQDLYRAFQTDETKTGHPFFCMENISMYMYILQ
jgi:hypothetical protein